MAWYAKNTGYYSIGTTQADGNCTEIYNFLYPLGYSIESICAIIGNVNRECAFNPWLWEGNSFRSTENYRSFTGGYGLVQWTPCTEYIDSNVARSYSTYAPNFSNQAGQYHDGNAQINFVDYQIHTPGNWFTATGGQYNAYLYRLSEIGIDYTRFYNMTVQQFMNASGPNPNITYTYDDWIGAFATCYLRPTSTVLARDWYKMRDAYTYYYNYFTGSPPTPPTPPIPPGPVPPSITHHMPVWMMIDYNN